MCGNFECVNLKRGKKCRGNEIKHIIKRGTGYFCHVDIVLTSSASTRLDFVIFDSM
jgi:hypothetical protein